MDKLKSRLDSHVEKTENLVNYLLRKKKENIQNSLVRPLYQEALKSVFFVCILLIDTLIPLDIFRVLPDPFNIIVSLGILGLFVYAQVRFYNMLWGKKGRWSLDKYRNHSDEGNEQKENS